MGQARKMQRRAVLKAVKEAPPMTLEETGVPQAVGFCLRDGLNVAQAIHTVLTYLPPMEVDAQENVKHFIRGEYTKHYLMNAPKVVAPDLAKKSGWEIVGWVIALIAMVGVTFVIQWFQK